MPKAKDIWDDPNLPSDKASIINKARMKSYGDPAPNMKMLAALWSVLLDTWIEPEMAATMLILLKVMREVQGGFDPDYPDNLEDMCGFVNVLYRVKEAKIESDDDAAGA